MKDQYFGDINDYRKYGLLRCFSAAGLSLGVCWMLTPNDQRSDGRRTEYLQQPHVFRHHDPALFDCLNNALERSRRTVGVIEQSGLLPATCFASAMIGSSRADRSFYFEHAANRFADSQLVFFDPDNGLEVKSVGLGTRECAKYLFWDELMAFWQAGHSILIYQHFRREVRSVFLERLATKFENDTGASLVATISTAHVAFVLAGQSSHRHVLWQGLAEMDRTWSGQLHVSLLRQAGS